MKQALTKQDYAKLNQLQKAWLVVECQKQGLIDKDTSNFKLESLSIGVLIGMLERNYQDIGIEYEEERWQLYIEDLPLIQNYNLIDALWKAVINLCGKES